jgi:hypothetical protein
MPLITVAPQRTDRLGISREHHRGVGKLSNIVRERRKRSVQEHRPPKEDVASFTVLPTMYEVRANANSPGKEHRLQVCQRAFMLPSAQIKRRESLLATEGAVTKKLVEVDDRHIVVNLAEPDACRGLANTGWAGDCDNARNIRASAPPFWNLAYPRGKRPRQVLKVLEGRTCSGRAGEPCRISHRLFAE